MLEVIAKGETSAAHPHPVLFVHGAFQNCSSWDEHFLGYFADNGFRAVAVSLRGHGRSPADKPLRLCSIADYVDDVASVADTLTPRPILVGHSMGGFIVQKYLEHSVYVLSAEQDAIYPDSDAHATAEFYNTQPTFIPDIGHSVTVEPRWSAAAESIVTWLEEHQL